MLEEIEAEPFDPRRCAELHNEILRRGWEGVGESLEHAELGAWWGQFRHTCDAEGLTPRLVPQLVEFLKHALYIPRELKDINGSYQNLFYYVHDLALPRELFSEDYIFGKRDDDPSRYVLLYRVTDLLSHSWGIMFDQHQLKARAIFSFTIDGTIVEEQDRPWVPLQSILQAYLEMIDLGKVIVVEDDCYSDTNGEDSEAASITISGQQPPWVLLPHSDAILFRTVEAFKRLLKAIETRMPNLPSEESAPPVTADEARQLKDAIEKLVVSSQISETGFCIAFLRHVQDTVAAASPALRFIAPGIRLLNSGDLLNQPFSEVDYHTSAYNNPILLFRAVDDNDLVCSTTFSNRNHNIFAHPYREATSYPCGLWISETVFDGAAFDDACRLLLPRSVVDRGEGREHHAKSSDGFILEHREGEGLTAGLYQTSCNPFIPRHEVELFRVLENWITMVEDGTWEVDVNGVSGGISKWMEANSDPSLAEKYRVPFTW